MISDWRVRVDHFVDLKKYANCEFTRDKSVPIQPKPSQPISTFDEKMCQNLTTSPNIGSSNGTAAGSAASQERANERLKQRFLEEHARMSREHEELLKNFSSLSEWMKHVNNTATTVKTGLLKTTYETLLADLTRLNSEIQLLQTARSTYNRILVGNDLINDTIKQINDNVDWMDNVDYKEQEIVDADSKATAVIEVS